jgi:HK97 family phage portal protein
MPITDTLRASLARVRDRVFPQAQPLGTKAHRAAPFVTFDGPRAAVWAPRDYAAFAREGFMQNPIVYRSVRMIAEAAASVPLLLYEGASEREAHPLLDLIRQPNSTTTTADFLEHVIGFLLVSGNAYVEAVATGDTVRALYPLRPDRIQIVPGPDGWPDGYTYTLDGAATRIAGDAIPGVRRILHLKQFHPLNDHYGMSPIEAASAAIDLHNTATAWNKALLDNSARPSGALVYTARDGNLTSDQYERLKRELEAGFQGALNAGRPLLLEGGLDWKPMSLSPKDMDFLDAKNAAAREIALALGVPPMLLAIPGDNTYSNYQEANRAFWRQTIIPLVNRIAAALTAWLATPRNAELAFRPDFDQVDALNVERDALWSRLNAATFLTPDEKRSAAGYDAQTSGTHSRGPPTQKFNPHHDGLGRFTSGSSNGDDPGGDTSIKPTASKPGKPPPQPPTSPKPAPPQPTKPDPGATPGGHKYTDHARQQATSRNFTDQRIDAILENNGATRIGKIDQQGRKTWEYRDPRGNTIVTNENGGIVTVFSAVPGGVYIEK